MSTSLASTSILVDLDIGLWSARMAEPRVVRDASAAHGADASLLSASKQLLAGRRAAAKADRNGQAPWPDSIKLYHAIASAATAARATHNRLTAPWDGKRRILTAALSDEYEARMAEAERDYWSAVHAFLPEYADLREFARGRLNGLWRAEEYPDAYDLRDRYRFSVEREPVPDAEALERIVGVSGLDTAVEALTARNLARATAATADTWQRVLSAVRLMAERCADPDAPIYESMVAGVRDIVAIGRGLNLTADGNLTAVLRRIEDTLSSADADRIRRNGAVRARLAAEAADVLAQAEAAAPPEALEDRPLRRLRCLVPIPEAPATIPVPSQGDLLSEEVPA